MSPDSEVPIRSFLFVPGDRPERFEKAFHCDADAIIIDLEDAVPSSAKERARGNVASWVSPARPVLLRINAPGSVWFAEDLKLQSLPGVSGIVLPKAESAEAIATLLTHRNHAVPVYPLIETALGMWNAREIASAPHVRQLLFGTLDFIADMGIGGDGAELDAYRAMLALASRVSGIDPPIDGVTAALDDPEALVRDAQNGRRLGFAGKLCVHPNQVPVVNDCYSPSAIELGWARRVLEAAGQSHGGALAVDGKMVDRPVLLKAQRLIAATRR